MISDSHLQLIYTGILIVYITVILPLMDTSLLTTFSNKFVRFILLLIIILVGIKDSLLSILLAIAFVSTHLRYQELTKDDV